MGGRKRASSFGDCAPSCIPTPSPGPASRRRPPRGSSNAARRSARSSPAAWASVDEVREGGRAMPTGEHFDAVVVGSGFGGSVSAYRLAEAGLSVCVLERGKRYPPHSFARTPREMRANFWDPSAGQYGLFQLWDFGGI